MTIYEELLENDLNPFILFDGDGKIKNFNKEAEFLLNFVQPKEIFNLAVSYASQTFGFRREFITLSYDKQSFYAILVGYVSDDEIALRLYKEVSGAKAIKIDTNLQESNIFTLIELSKSTTLLGSNMQIEEIYDVSIPLAKLNVNEFLLCINNIFEQLSVQTKNLILKVSIKTGEYEVINKIKYKIISIDFTSKDEIEFYPLKVQSGKHNIFNISILKNTIKLELPLIV